MAAWLPVLKAALPYIGNIVAAAVPVFTRRKEQDASAELVSRQIAELQEAVTGNVEAVKGLAAQVERTITALDAGERKHSHPGTSSECPTGKRGSCAASPHRCARTTNRRSPPPRNRYHSHRCIRFDRRLHRLAALKATPFQACHTCLRQIRCRRSWSHNPCPSGQTGRAQDAVF